MLATESTQAQTLCRAERVTYEVALLRSRTRKARTLILSVVARRDAVAVQIFPLPDFYGSCRTATRLRRGDVRVQYNGTDGNRASERETE